MGDKREEKKGKIALMHTHIITGQINAIFSTFKSFLHRHNEKKIGPTTVNSNNVFQHSIIYTQKKIHTYISNSGL